ncbi:DUF4342 domain-containing protein [Candidatus Falkowbacteria bacterium]|nr:DUF4342 domain-containing protein [Candidatus Falkowbacteria bacterium]
MTEEFKVSGEEILKKVKEIIKEGNARKIIIKNEKDESIMEIPLTFAVVGAVLLPVLAAVGAIAGILTKCTLVVEKK